MQDVVQCSQVVVSPIRKSSSIVIYSMSMRCIGIGVVLIYKYNKIKVTVNKTRIPPREQLTVQKSRVFPLRKNSLAITIVI